ncbi:MAG: hypothetical protein AAFO29_21140, partial [Actinomycetota bacterium]
VSGHGPAEGAAAWFRVEPERIEAALADHRTLDAFFSPDPAEPLVLLSPLLVFAIVVGRGASEIGDHPHVVERIGNRQLVPVFDGADLARFTADPAARAFLVELLGSYTRVLSGPRWERSRGRWRRRRFSEMNPAQLAQLAAETPMADRAGAYRRLGDLALFLNGVFPDNSARQSLSPIELGRVLRSLPPGERIESTRLLEASRIDGVGPVMAALGPAWYRLAATLVPIPGAATQLSHVAEHFESARRFLNFVTDRYLWERRDGLFGLA